jgi:hypothetical protein
MDFFRVSVYGFVIARKLRMSTLGGEFLCSLIIRMTFVFGTKDLCEVVSDTHFSSGVTFFAIFCSLNSVGGDSMPSVLKPPRKKTMG